ncbi:MAG: DUF4351 domain-containing protein [Xenococcaceae cyanobacterium]
MLRQLKRKLSGIDADLEAQIRALDIDSLEELGEALLDFSTLADVRDWLNNKQNS